MLSARYSKALAVPALLAAGAAYLASSAWAQSYQTHNLTPDGYWHNRYHMLLSMAVYGDYNSVCPNQTFTEENKLKNFPDATRPAWTVVNTFGPTPSGCKGFTAIIPEMNKALIIFSGDYQLEQNLPLDTMLWQDTKWGNGTSNDTALPARCEGCRVNEFAMQGYLECKTETNDWQAIRAAYYGQDLVFSITGHGLGGMHSQIASIDLYEQEIDYYSHAYGSPRTFNSLGATWYADRFNGEAGERGIANDDQYTESIPEGTNYSHAGTPFYYWGYNGTSLGMNMRICWLEDDPDYSACMPQDMGTGGTPEQDHYFYFTPVTECGLEHSFDAKPIDAFISSAKSGPAPSYSLTMGSTSSAAPSSTPPPAQTTGAPAPTGSSASDQGGSGAMSLASFSFASLIGMAILTLAPSL